MSFLAPKCPPDPGQSKRAGLNRSNNHLFGVSGICELYLTHVEKLHLPGLEGQPREKGQPQEKVQGENGDAEMNVQVFVLDEWRVS